MSPSARANPPVGGIADLWGFAIDMGPRQHHAPEACELFHKFIG